MKEILTLHIGQAGCQIGNAIWELYTAEHSINNFGESTDLTENSNNSDNRTGAFFEYTSNCKYVPRAMFIDTEPTVIDEIKSASYKNLFNPNYLINNSEDSASIFSRGYFHHGNLTAYCFNKNFTSLVEQCDNPYALMVFRSYAGGTGSGLTSSLMDILNESFPKLNKIEVSLLPTTRGISFIDPIVSPYNSILGLHYGIDDFSNSILADNDALIDVIRSHLLFHHSSFTPLNRFFAQACSNLTSSSRFDAPLYNDFLFMQTNLIPYPRLHFPLLHYAPCTNTTNADFEINVVQKALLDVFSNQNGVLSVNHFDGKFMSCCLNFRGAISPYEVYCSLNVLKMSALPFVDWCPTTFKVGITNKPLATIPGSHISPSECSLTMIANSSSISQALYSLCMNFTHLYTKRAFIHWFVGDGLEEEELKEALLNINCLAQDYVEVQRDSDE